MVADTSPMASGGIAVLVDGGAFAAATLLRVTGDDRRPVRPAHAPRRRRRTSRSSAAAPAGAGTATTVTVAEGVEGRLVRVSATIVGGPTARGGRGIRRRRRSGRAASLSARRVGDRRRGLGHRRGITIVGVVGQRDSSGTGRSATGSCRAILATSSPWHCPRRRPAPSHLTGTPGATRANRRPES